MGLKAEALAFLEENVKTVPNITCPCCNYIISQKEDKHIYEDASELGMFNDGPNLYVYNLKSGDAVKEIVQATPWASGPVIFFCLENSKGERLFEWSEAEIESNL